MHALLFVLLASGCRGPRTGGRPEQAAQAENRVERARAESGEGDASSPRARAKEDPLCRNVGSGVERGKLSGDRLDEVSGLVESRAQPNLLWVHNDSGDSARIYAIERSGKLRVQVDLRGADAVDFEDIAIGPGPIEGQHYLYVADIGDNLARRRWVQIYRLPEPDLASLSERKITVAVERIDLAYEGGARDAEALMIDPRSGDLYIVSKGAIFARKNAPMAVFRVPREELASRKVTAKPVATVALGPVTAADVLPDGSGLAVRNYKTLLFWPRGPQQSLFEALSGDFCEWPLEDAKRQGEAFGFRADGRGYYTTSEGWQQPIYEYLFE